MFRRGEPLSARKLNELEAIARAHKAGPLSVTSPITGSQTRRRAIDEVVAVGEFNQDRAIVTGRTSDDMRFLAKVVDSHGVPLKGEDGSDLPAIEVWVDTWPPGTPIGDCLQQFEVDHEIPLRYHVRYDDATETDVRRAYIDDILLSIKCDGGGGGR